MSNHTSTTISPISTPSFSVTLTGIRFNQLLFHQSTAWPSPVTLMVAVVTLVPAGMRIIRLSSVPGPSKVILPEVELSESTRCLPRVPKPAPM